jgi:hypothetical protein
MKPLRAWPAYQIRDPFLERILRRCGRYYESGDLFYQRMWHLRLSQIGFRVISVQKLSYHQLWDIKLFGTLTSESYLLVSKPVRKAHLFIKDLLLRQFQVEIQEIARDLGAPIGRDSIQVDRKGAYFRAIFIWPLGKPGLWVKPEKKAEAFSFLMRSWLRRNRN